MKSCRSGRVIKKTKNDGEFYYLRLNLIDKDSETGEARYSTSDIPTGLPAGKRNNIRAQVMLDEAISHYSDGADELEVSCYLMDWVEKKKPTLEATTYDGYCYRLGIAADYFRPQKLPLSALAPSHIWNFYNYMLTAEHGSGKRHAVGYSNRVLRDVATVLRSALEDAVTLKYLRENPASRIKVPHRITERKTKAYVSADEAGLFLEIIRGHRLETVFIVCLFYGLRREEAVGLKWSAIHDDGRLYIEHTVTKVRTAVAKDRTKTDASYRSYPIPEDIRKSLEAIRETQNRNRKLFGGTYQESDYIFTWEDGHPYSPDYVTKAFKKLVRSDERLDGSLTLHSLRASCVSILIHNGTDIKDVQEWVGHKDVQTTLNIYARTNEKQKLGVANRMSDTLFHRSDRAS